MKSIKHWKILKTKKLQYNKLKQENDNSIKLLKDKKEKYNKLIKQVTKDKKIYKILTIIDTLKKEGLLIGRNRMKIKGILTNNIESLSLNELDILEDKLIFHLPEKYYKT